MTRTVIDRLTPIINHKNDPLYAEPEIRRVCDHVVELPSGLIGIVDERDDAPSMTQFAVFVLEIGPDTRHGEVKPALYRRVFHGEGSARARELRHSWWGEPANAGCIFYPNAKLLTAALTVLQRWFDCD